MDETSEAARRVAEQLLATSLPRRWRHVQAVAATAERVSPILPADDRDALLSAAWLHDIGYSPHLAVTGFHPLDGARWLRAHSFDGRIAHLVAHHSYAVIEAEERGLATQLTAEFPREISPAVDALWFCDMTTGPDGEPLDVLDRLGEARSRYGPGDVVTRFLTRAQDELVAAVRRTEARISATARSAAADGCGTDQAA